MSGTPSSDECALNTDREIWRKGDGDGNGMSYYEPSIHVTEQGAIGINVGGTVHVRTVEDWLALSFRLERAEAALREAEARLRGIACYGFDVQSDAETDVMVLGWGCCGGRGSVREPVPGRPR